MITSHSHPSPQATSPLQVIFPNGQIQDTAEGGQMFYEDLFQMLYEDGSIMLYEG